ncbi:gluconate 2-dehydrogenase subunit 3 family protein [Novosphingobium sp. ZW T3_23]|uniref:gluconate 2-dehydrogenase subunit 3 family protein n=1 Tax=Novosphingobium sp. ZW T3_23 TaxID=3378084 RepID=UPI0038556162
MSGARKGWNRREFAGGAALLALALGIPVAGVRLTDLDSAELPSDRQRRLIAEVSDLVIPRTDTPGAMDVGVGDFVVLALAHGLSGTRAPMASGMVTAALEPFRRRDGSLRHLPWLEHALDRAAGGDFLRHGTAERSRLLAALDAEAFAQGAAFSPWTALKGLILTGYYTSEAGGSQELRYELVPGKWEWDIPMTPEMRAFSSDWTAVDFG